jgi:glycine C-acetyltransferase
MFGCAVVLCFHAESNIRYTQVPKGDEEIRFQINADYTPHNIDSALDVLASFN